MDCVCGQSTYRCPIGKEVDYQKLGSALLIAPSLVLAVRTARWPTIHSYGFADVDWQKEVKHSARIAKVMLTHLSLASRTCSLPEMSPGTQPLTVECQNNSRQFISDGGSDRRVSSMRKSSPGFTAHGCHPSQGAQL